MDLQKALTAIKRGEVAPIYLVLGKERYLADLFRQTIYTRVLADEEAAFNFSTFDLKETSISTVLAEAESVPFFGDYRLIFIENPYFLTGEKYSGGSEQNIDALLDYLAAPLKFSILVFLAPYEKLDERKKVVKQLKKAALLVDVAPMKEREVQKYVEQYIQNAGYKISAQALTLLLDLCEMELSRLMSELSKLFLYASETKSISKAAVFDLVPKSLEYNIFDMTTYVLTGETGKAVTLFQDLLLQGEDTIKINAILLSQVRLLLQVKLLVDMGYQQGNIVNTLKIHPYRVKLAMQQIRRFKIEHLGYLFDQLVENEYRMKTGQMDKELLFELFILQATA